jgi:hypothetical protein
MNLTREQIMNATPAQLCEWVAVDVMGLKDVTRASGGEFVGIEGLAESGELIYGKSALARWDYVPNYPEDIAAAWQVWNKLFELGHWVQVNNTCDSGKVDVLIVVNGLRGKRQYKEAFVFEKFETAICRAALFSVNFDSFGLGR